MQCDALSLDLDETVVDYSVSTVDALEAIGGGPADLALWRTVSARAERALDEGAIPVTELDRARVRSFHHERSGRVLAEHELTRLVAARRAGVLESVRVFPDALHLLERARGLGLRCIAVSNSYSALRDAIVHRLGLAPYFTHVTFCGDGGPRKPDGRAFDAGLRALGCPPGRLVHLGDELRSDVVGARNAGAQGVHVNRARAGCRHAEPCIASLDVPLERHGRGAVVHLDEATAARARPPAGEQRTDAVAAP
ncbi:HAD family hydrolase [Cellulomonas sp. NPDC055163]